MRAKTAMRLMCVTVTALLISSCEKEVAEAPEVARPVRILTISTLQGGETLSYPGVIQGAQNADLAFEVPGRLIEFPAEEGLSVEQGQLLAKLDPADFQAALDAAQARYNSAKSTFERFKEVFEKGAISRQQFDNSVRQFEVEQAQLASAEKALRDTELRAPFTGRIGRTYVENFNNVQAKQAILLLQDVSSLEVVLNVPEQDWLRAKPGVTLAQATERSRPRIGLSNLPGREFPAELAEIATAADPVTRTFAVRARFSPPDDLIILPGMSATVTINVPDDVAILTGVTQIPVSAVIGGDDGGSYVWKIDSETMRASLAPVTIGQMSGSLVSIVEGVDEGDRIAISGVQHLTDGMQVRELTD